MFLKKFFLSPFQSFKYIITQINTDYKKIKKLIGEKCTNYSGPTWLAVLMRDGLNIGLHGDSNSDPDSRFYIGLTFYLSMLTIYIYEGIGSAIYWTNEDMLLITGNWIVGLGLPQLVTFLAVSLGDTLSLLPYLYTSIQVLKRNKNLWLLMNPIKLITGHSNELESSVNEEIIK